MAMTAIGQATTDSTPAAVGQTPVKPAKKEPPVVHSEVGDVSHGVAPKLKITNIGKRHQYPGGPRRYRDTDIFSPKSVTFSVDGKRMYINSLEGGRTVVYDTDTLGKTAVINYSFAPAGHDTALFAPLSGYYAFTHYDDGQNRPFVGKPVESAWSHDGRYLWVPFYRRTFDINAQDPSAVAVVDSRNNRVVRVFETGPLPKMITTTHNDSLIAITHWGDNTVGFIDISGADPDRWHHLPPVTVGHKLVLDYPLTTSVNRDANSGYLLRGMIFTPDARYLLVSAMAGPLAVIDVAQRRHVGFVHSLYGIRHLDISGGTVFGSMNVAGAMISFDLDSLLSGIEQAKQLGSRDIKLPGGARRTKVGRGARTLSISPDGAYAFVACNGASAVYVVDTEAMKVVDSIRCDSYPVGLALSPDGRLMAVTSQARSHRGGNAVNLFRIDRPDLDSIAALQKAARTADSKSPAAVKSASTGTDARSLPWMPIAIAAAVAIVVIAVVIVVRFRRRSRTK